MTIVDKVAVPPGGWYYKVEQTGVTIARQTLRELIDSVGYHLIENGHIMPPNLAKEIEEQICSRLPPGRCIYRERSSLSHVPALNSSQALAGTLTLLEWAIKGARKVSHDEAERRALICSSCNLNLPASGCSACLTNKVRDKVAKFVGSKKTSVDQRLNYCVSCGCSLKASVWLPLDIQLKHSNPDINAQLPAHCWKKTSTP